MGSSGSGSGSGWGQAAVVVGNAAVNAYAANQAAKEQKKAAKAAAQPRYEIQYQTPYMNDRLAAIIPYILQSQQSVFENRMKGYGGNVNDFSAIANLLAGISPNYSGVGVPGSPMDNQYGGAGMATAFNSSPQGKTASGMPTFYGGTAFSGYRGLTGEDAAKRDEIIANIGERRGGVFQFTDPQSGQTYNMVGSPTAGSGKRVQRREGSVLGGDGLSAGGAAGSSAIFEEMFRQNYNARHPDRGISGGDITGLIGSALRGYDTSGNATQAIAGQGFGYIVPGGELMLGAVDRGMLDRWLYDGQLIQPTKSNPDSWWNKGNVVGTSMDFENAGNLDSIQGNNWKWGN